MNMNMNYSYLLNMKVPRNHGSRNTTTGAMSNLTLSLFSLAFSNSEARDHLNDGIKGGSPPDGRWFQSSFRQVLLSPRYQPSSCASLPLSPDTRMVDNIYQQTLVNYASRNYRKKASP